ncbi:MAG TPA: response regulator transcription factor [Acidimicrobiales bacterium]|jgi:DNA-binding response OmpR family regulator
MARLLLVEDDDAIALPLAGALEREGHEVVRLDAGRLALDEVESQRPDLVLLDLGLPDLDGLEVCRRVKAGHPDLPVIILTARAEEVDTVVGLDAGADDYVTKPFRLAELLARIRARLRTSPETDDAPSVIEALDVRVDRAAHRAWLGDAELDLTPKEYGLLELLVRKAGVTLARDRIMREVWDEHWYGSTKTLDMHISWLRRKLGDDPTDPRHVVTVRGVGFRFETGE